MQYYGNIFAVYKPSGITSHDVVDHVRKATGVKKVGHAGTLDPAATGVLVVAVGRPATKKLSQITAGEKEYLAQITLGCTSKTHDNEAPIQKLDAARPPAQNEISRALARFVGIISQKPPSFSAVKVKGKPAYKLARTGKSVNLEPKNVEIKDIQLLDYRWPLLTIKTTTGPGVYIRALARDLGKSLGTGALLRKLERTRVGSFTKEDAVPLEEFDQLRRQNSPATPNENIPKTSA